MTLNFPHVRIASGNVTIWTTADEYARANPDRVSQTFEPGWHHSRFDAREIIHSGADKVHVKLQFTRYDQHGVPLATYPSLWIVTRLDGRWGIQARSSFAP